MTCECDEKGAAVDFFDNVCYNATIYREYPSQPSTWDNDWNLNNLPVVCGYKPKNK